MAPRTILLVDDEAAVRSFVGAILRRENFHVLEAGDGIEALELAQRAGPIDLLVTDVRMPRMDGIALSRAFYDVHPDTPVLFISGYPLDLDTVPRPAGTCCYLPKPFTRQALMDAVIQCLPAVGHGAPA